MEALSLLYRDDGRCGICSLMEPGETKSHAKAVNRISLIYWQPGASKLNVASLGICAHDLEQYREECYSYSYRSHCQSSSRMTSDIKIEIQYFKRVEETAREIIQTKRILPKFSDLMSVP